MANPLSRVAMGNLIKDSKPIISPRISPKVDSRQSNLDYSEKDLILDIIKGEREVVEVTKANKAITLEEAADRIKNNR